MTLRKLGDDFWCAFCKVARRFVQVEGDGQVRCPVCLQGVGYVDLETGEVVERG